MKDWLKLAGRQGAEKNGKAEKLWSVGKSENVDFKARNNWLRDRESALERWQGVEVLTVVE